MQVAFFFALLFAQCEKPGRDTKEPSPERATWLDEIGGGVILVLSIDTDGIPNSTGQKLTLNPNVSEGWKDPSYPHNEDSIGKDLKSVRARWLRALALHKTPVLFADLEPADCLQGSTGNCWFVAALAGLAEFPAYLKNNIMLNKKALHLLNLSHGMRVLSVRV